MFSGFNKVGIVPSGSLPNASLVGAKTVKSPFPLRVGAKPAAFTAVKRVDRAGVAAAVPAIVFNEDVPRLEDTKERFSISNAMVIEMKRKHKSISIPSSF